MPYILVVNGSGKRYNHVYKFGVCEVETYEEESIVI